MDIVFINPPGLSYSGFPYGIAILAQILKEQNFEVAVIDASAEKLNESQVVDKVLSFNPEIAGITGLIQASSFNKNISKLLRCKCPAVKQIGGGWWASPAAEFVLRNTCIDYLVVGEADLIIGSLVSALINKRPVFDIPGLCYLDVSGAYVGNIQGRLPEVLTELPLPAYDLFNMEFYMSKVKPEEYALPLHPAFLEIFKERKHKTLNIISMTSGRGCYGRCDFCSASGILRRNYSPAYVVNHMEILAKKYGANTFNFTESLTLSTKNWVKEFCREIINRNLNIYYIALSRGDLVYDQEMLGLLRDSGCVAVGFGFESGNNEMLTRFHKKTTVEQYCQVIQDFQNNGIRVGGSLILNMPGETLKSLNDTVNFIKKTKIIFGIGFAYPYPGTKLFDFAKNNGFVDFEDVMFTVSNKMLTTRKLFNEYLLKYNWNKFDSLQLWRVNKKFEILSARNHFYNKNKNSMIRKFFDKNPDFSTGLLMFYKKMGSSILFMGAFPARAVKKLRRILTNLLPALG